MSRCLVWHLQIVKSTSVVEWVAFARSNRLLHVLLSFSDLFVIFCLSRSPIVQKAFAFKKVFRSILLLWFLLTLYFLLHHGNQFDKLCSFDLLGIEIVGFSYIEVTDNIFDLSIQKHVNVN